MSDTPAIPLIELQDAGVAFGPRLGLQGINLQVHAGDRLALLGGNGAGKTTLLRLLHGRLSCSHGRRVIPAGPACAQAMVYQRPFVLRVSVWRNLSLALWLAGVPLDQRAPRIEAGLRRVGLLDQRFHPARALSTGQRQRLALARAWIAQPRVLLLDEPTASLDPTAKREVEDLIEALADDGLTLIMSTHNLGQAKRLARRVLFLDAGRLITDMSTDAFFNANLPPSAALFLRGETPWLVR